MGRRYFLMLHDALHISDTPSLHIAFTGYTAWDGNGWILCGTGRELFSTWLQLAGTWREWIYLSGTGWDWLWFSFPCSSLRHSPPNIWNTVQVDKGPWTLVHPAWHIGPHSVSVKSCHLCFLPGEPPGLIQGDTKNRHLQFFNKIFWTCDLMIASPALYQVHLHRFTDYHSTRLSEYPLLSVNSKIALTTTGCLKEIAIVDDWLSRV